MTYITVDLDEPDTLDIVKAWFDLEKYGGNGPWGRLSSSGEGIHLRNKSILPEEVPVALVERIMAGDDPKRAWEDYKQTYEPNQILFDVKRGNRAGMWTNDLDQLLQWYREGLKV